MRVIFKDQNAAKVKIQYLLIRQKHLHIFGDLCGETAFPHKSCLGSLVLINCLHVE